MTITDVDSGIAGTGHNQPPEDPHAWLREELADRHAKVLHRAHDLGDAFSRVPAEIADDEQAGRVSDFIKQLTACVKESEAARTAEKEPFIARGRVVDGFFKSISDPLDGCAKKLRERVTVYLRKKEEAERRRREAEARAAREEAERAAAAARAAEALASDDDGLEIAVEAEQQASAAAADAIVARQAAAAKPADLSRTRGDYGSVASLRATWTFEVTDRKKVDLETLRPYLAAADVDKAIRAAIKSGVRDLRGCRIYQSTSAAIR